MFNKLSLTIVFQPIIDLLTGDAVGYEALGCLVGREHEGLSAITESAQSPEDLEILLSDVQQLAFHRGSFRPPGTWLFLKSTRALVRQFTHHVRWQQKSFHDVVLEVPESDHDVAEWASLAAPLRNDGLQIALDDWGVGYADPVRVAHLQPEWIKIARLVTEKVGKDPAMDRLVTVVAHWLSASRTRIIADGIETEEQLIRLRALGIRLGQGSYLAPPSCQFVESVSLPEPARRLGQIAHLPLALAQSYPLNDDHLELIEMNVPLLRPIIQEAIHHLAQWIVDSAASTKFSSISSLDRFTEVLAHHFQDLTRGYLSTEDLERADRIAAVHHRYDIDLSWFVLGYRDLEIRVTEALRATGHETLAEALQALFSWDSSLILDAYQRPLHLDQQSGLTRRQTFLDQVSLDAKFRQENHQSGLLILIDAFLPEELAAPFATEPTVTIGVILQRYQSARNKMGRLGETLYGMWLDALPERDINRIKRHLYRDLTALLPNLDLAFATGLLGVHADSFEALYQYVEGHLTRHRNPAKAHETSLSLSVPQEIFEPESLGQL